MSADVFQLPPTGHRDTSPKRLPAQPVAWVHEAGTINSPKLRPYYKAASRLLESIAGLDLKLKDAAKVYRRNEAAWQRYGDLADHRPFLSPLKFWLFLIALIGGELTLAKTFAEGLQLPSHESWLIAIGVVGGTAMLGAGLAHSTKQLFDDHFLGQRLNWGTIFVSVLGLGLLLLGLGGMFYVRDAYYLFQVEELGASAEGSEVMNAGLTMLQAFLVFGIAAVFWIRAGHHRAETARKNYVRSQKALYALLKQRDEASSELTMRFRTLEASWNETIATYMKAIAEWADEMVLQGTPLEPFEVTPEDFLALPPAILAPANPVPALLHSDLSVTENPAAERIQDRLSGLTPRKPVLVHSTLAEGES